MRIGELARSVGVNVETIRYYQRIGLLELPQRPYGGTRCYGRQDLKRLRFIRRAQQIGFSLEDIRALLELSSSDCKQVGKLADEKLNLVHAKLRQLRRIESILSKTVEQLGLCADKWRGFPVQPVRRRGSRVSGSRLMETLLPGVRVKPMDSGICSHQHMTAQDG
jgi:DNA-binding transcriptional MerR regulator